MRRHLLAMTVLLATAACSRTFTARVVQTHPMALPAGASRTSAAAEIVLGDMELRVPPPPAAGQHVTQARPVPYPLRNRATFSVVSRDRLRFHVHLEHKWPTWADPRTWEVYLVDGDGHRFEPEGMDRARQSHVTSMWDRELRTAQRDWFGDVVAYNQDGWRRREPLGSLSVFTGVADVTFYQPDLMSRDLSSVKLVVTRPGTTLEFRWDFQLPRGDDAPPTMVAPKT